MSAKPRRNTVERPYGLPHNSDRRRRSGSAATESRKERRPIGQAHRSRTRSRPRAAHPAKIEIAHLTKRFITPSGEPFTAIRDVSLTVEPGQFCAIVGPTGCGKSTTLGQVSGLDRPSAGSVQVGGREVRGITTGVSFMFQADALFPWKSVLGNVMIGPILNGTPKKDAVALSRDWLRRVGLAGFEDRYPHQLSGGMRKRVAMAAALINSPRILLMDEPFGALDVQTKAIMQTELLGLWEQLRPSVLFITHDLDEAVALADRVLRHDQQPRARSRRVSTSTCPGLAARCRPSGTSRASSSCRTRSGPPSRTRSSAPTPGRRVPREHLERDHWTQAAGARRRQRQTGRAARQAPPPVLALDRPARLRRLHHRRLAALSPR